MTPDRARLIASLDALHRQKDHAYGDAWCRRGEILGIFTNLARKYDRLVRALDETLPSEVESISDTLSDLAIYSAKYVVWLGRDVRSASSEGVVESGSPDAVAAVLREEGSRTDGGGWESAVSQLRAYFAKLEQAILARAEGHEVSLEERVIAARGVVACCLELLAAVIEAGDDQWTVPEHEGSFVGQVTYQALFRWCEQPGGVLILGATAEALIVQRRLTELGLGDAIVGIADPSDSQAATVGWGDIARATPRIVVVASDRRKEELLREFAAAVGTFSDLPRVVIAGMEHLAFADSLYDELDAPALVPSYATGYAWTRVHMFQVLRAAAAQGIGGALVEFGAFKGGTTAWLARCAQRLGLDSKVIAFDSWSGFPPRRSVLDMYEHPRCVFTDITAVRQYLAPYSVEIVPGDITDTAPERLAKERVLLAFIDTDNYSPALAALRAVVKNLVVGGAIVFDHYTTTDEYVYTLGERMAGNEALRDEGLLNLHGTGVFIKVAANG